jgi:hypothetical protein
MKRICSRPLLHESVEREKGQQNGKKKTDAMKTVFLPHA